ncbi:hypothetical protein ACROYT_G004868 [Oculina patagonica]
MRLLQYSDVFHVICLHPVAEREHKSTKVVGACIGEDVAACIGEVAEREHQSTKGVRGKKKNKRKDDGLIDALHPGLFYEGKRKTKPVQRTDL